MRNSPVYSLKTVYTGLVQRTGYTVVTASTLSHNQVVEPEMID